MLSTQNLINKLYGKVINLIEIVIFLLISLFAVSSITEISSRDSFLGYLQDQIRNINSELALNSSTLSNELSEERSVILRSKLSEYNHLLALTESLINVGANGEHQDLVSIRLTSEEVHGVKNTGIESGNPLRSSFFFSKELLVYLNSDYLLAIAIMTCGAIGSMVGSIRREKNLSLRSILFGLSTGFIIYLAIKGGKQVFLTQEKGQIIQFNPYSSGLAGLISGLFTERSFSFLQVSVDSFFKKLEKSIQ